MRVARSIMARCKTICGSVVEYMRCLRQLPLIAEQNRFLLSEIHRINQSGRATQYGVPDEVLQESKQTKESFEFQWQDMPNGVPTQNTEEYLEQVDELVCKLTDLPRDWFKDKVVADVGCGGGRYSRGLLKLGARVFAYDQSESALERNRELNKEFGERLKVEKIDILNWEPDKVCDLVFCFGVVHHTGNTYKAIYNVQRMVKERGYLFLMVYGYPQTLAEYKLENNARLERRALDEKGFQEKKRYISSKYGARKAHALFDSFAPNINELLTYEEIRRFLECRGFVDVRRTVPHRNHRIVAMKSY